MLFKIITEQRIGFVKPSWTRLEVNRELTIHDFDELMQRIDDMLEDQIKFQKIIGKMLYLTLTRSYIAYVVQILVSS